MFMNGLFGGMKPQGMKPPGQQPMMPPQAQAQGDARRSAMIAQLMGHVPQGAGAQQNGLTGMLRGMAQMHSMRRGQEADNLASGGAFHQWGAKAFPAL